MVSEKIDGDQNEHIASSRAVGILRVARDNWLALSIIAVVIVAYLLLRTRPSDLTSLQELDNVISGGQPTLVEFYSNV